MSPSTQRRSRLVSGQAFLNHWRFTRWLLWMLCLGLFPASSTQVAAQNIGKKYAVLVGVDKYDPSQLNRLNYTVADAEELAKQFKQLGFDVTLMTLAVENPQLHPNTPAKIEKVLNNRAQGLTENDTLIFGFMGHGVQFAIDKGMGEESETQELYFCPAEAQLDDRDTLLSLEKVYALLQESKAGRKLLIVDACRNNPQPKNKTRSKEVELEPVGKKIRTVPTGMVAFFSCSAGEKSHEYPALVDGRGHGAFTAQMLKYLRGDAAEVWYPKGELALPEMLNYVSRETKDYVWNKDKQDQIPVPYGKVGSWTLGRVEDVLRQNITNSIGMQLRAIPAGKFVMSSPPTELGHDGFRQLNEKQVNVEITKAFYLGAHEVTQGEWIKVMGTKPWKGKKFVEEGANYPATYISWTDANAFCKKLGVKEGKTYRLPTEAEWEYACRAGSKTAFYFGADVRKLKDYAWYMENTWDQGWQAPQVVGQKKPNAWGLYDMHGNVWEWCGDWYDDKLAGGKDPVGAARGEFRVNRGGGWDSFPLTCRSSMRVRDKPDYVDNILGFRVVLIPPRK
ncbi:MAG: SUMF1/EgtB/PvdO family nonheme iron enzyme [Pirellulales bacterium]|nr:SUMF1/EgtB/PvdO family nonheme iron enzyme [Pirellulales bacterium]